MSVAEPISRSAAIFAAETATIRAWASIKPCISSFELLEDQMLIRVSLKQPETGELFYLEGDFNGYRELPPLFTFSSQPWNRSNQRNDYPKPADPNPFGGGSIFHPQPCICANFSRGAYHSHGGPHNDWGGPERWLEAAAGGPYVRAYDAPSMLSVVYTRFVYTRGRLQ